VCLEAPGPVLRELSSVNASMKAAEAALLLNTTDTGITQTMVQHAPIDLGTWDGVQLPVQSLQGLQGCGLCPAFVHMWSSTKDMTQKQNVRPAET